MISEPRSLTSELEARRKIGKQRIEGQNLAGTTLPRAWNGRQRPAIQHARDSLGDARAGGGMAFDEIGKPCQHDAAHHPLRQRIAERCGGGKGLEARMAVALRMGQAVAGEFAHGRGDAIDDHIGVLVDQPKEGCPAIGNRPQGAVRQPHLLALPGDAPVAVEVDIRPLVQDDSHSGSLAGQSIGTCPADSHAPRSRLIASS